MDEGVVDAPLVEGEVGEPDRSDRPALGLGDVAEQGGGPLAGLAVADRRRAQRP